MNLFGKKNQKAKQPTPQASAENVANTIRMLRDNLETLEKREAHINKKMEVALGEAKQKAAKGDKKGALFALKRKKMYEGEINKLQGSKITLDSQIMSLESAAVNVETFKVMKAGADAMKGVRGNLDADTVADMMDEMEEEKAIHDQIAEAISRPAEDMFDDEELLNELAELEELGRQEAAQSAAPQTVFAAPAVPTYTLPAVPTAPVVAQSIEESDDERVLRELQASMLA